MPGLSFRCTDRRILALSCYLRFAILIVLPLSVLAQGSGRSSTGNGGNHIIQGYVFFPSGRRAEGSIQVKLQNYSSGESSVVPDSSGSFTFSSLVPGSYTVVVNAGADYEVARESVYIDSDMSVPRSGMPLPSPSRRYTVMVHLQLKTDNRAKASVINAALAEVPESARKSYETGLELARSGETTKAIDSLEEAVKSYPRFPLALNELGVQYLKLGKAEKAVEVLNSAIKLDPGAFNPRLNRGIALLEARQFREARDQLSEALKRNGSTPTTHMYFALALAHLGNIDEAEKELLKAIQINGNLGLAHYYLGGLYWKKRNYAQAVEELEKYLELTPNAPDVERVRKTIRDLRSRM